jgi:hypothetical protein
MNRKSGWRSGVGLLVGLLIAVGPAVAGGIDDFKLTRAIPADSMLVVQCREHTGRAFVNEQFKRVWAAVEKQGFERDVKRLLRGLIKQSAGDVEAFDEQWQQVSDLAATVTWSQLAGQEFACAMKLGMPTGVDFVFLLVPPADQVGKDFDGLVALLKGLSGLAPEGMLALASEGEGEVALHRLSVAGQMPPISLTLARQKDVLLVGFGSSLVEQSLALLRGESKVEGATLASTERFQQALGRLPAPTDSYFFMDLNKWMAQARGFIQMAVQATTPPPTTEPAGETTTSPVAFLPKLIDEVDIFDYVASVASTDGMQTTKTELAVLRDDAKSRVLYKLLYGGGPAREPLKYIPKEATAVTIRSGLDLGATYQAMLDFVGRELPSGKELLTTWQTKQDEIGFNLEADLFSWLGSGFAKFSASGRTSYSPDWLFLLGVKDEAKANALLDKITQLASEKGQEQQIVFGEPREPGLEGFKVFSHPMLAMFMGQPVFGVKTGQLFVGSNERVVLAALKTAAGEQENFSKSERFAQEGLPLGDNVTAFSFEDLTKFGDELSQALSMVGAIQAFLPAELQKDPTMMTALSVVTKIGRVVKNLDFYRSSCEVTTFDGKVCLTKGITHYQEPPKKAPESAPADKPADGEAGAKPAAEPKAEKPNQ